MGCRKHYHYTDPETGNFIDHESEEEKNAAIGESRKNRRRQRRRSCPRDLCRRGHH